MRAKVLIVALALALVGCGDGSPGGSTAPPQDTDIAVIGTDAFEFVPSDPAAEAGEITVALTCEQALQHDFVVETETEDVTVAECGGGETSVGSIELEASAYTFFCSIPGHRQAGMEGTLTVA